MTCSKMMADKEDGELDTENVSNSPSPRYACDT